MAKSSKRYWQKSSIQRLELLHHKPVCHGEEGRNSGERGKIETLLKGDTRKEADYWKIR